MTETLDRLAALAGIEEGWWDFFGHYRVVPAETKAAFLTAMGFPVSSEADRCRAIAALEQAPWRRRLDPVAIVAAGTAAPEIAVVVPAAQDGGRLAWSLDEEGGARSAGEAMIAALPVAEESAVDGLSCRRRRLTLAGPVPEGLHRLTVALPDGEATTTLIGVPETAWRPDALADGGRLWGIATQLYALRGDGGWGIGDFSDLARLGRAAGALGAAAIGVNPLHALFPARPERFSPYSASSRIFLNIAYIDVEAVPEFREAPGARRLFAAPGFQAGLAASDHARLIDHPAVLSAKLAVLRACWRHFVRHHLDAPDSARGALFRGFVERGGERARTLAVFDALQEHFLERDPAKGYWRDWPDAYRDPAGPAVAAFAASHRAGVLFFLYLQWLADAQLAGAQAACREAGMSVGVYRDLGVGIAEDGGEAWANQSLLCLGVSVGAPPDPLNLAGQDWGLVPFNPLALREAAYRPFLEVLEANMTHAGAMRVDHAMSLQRLYWVPEGAKADQGAYVRYPVDDLSSLLALASRRKRCLVIGEDLGTVPDGFRERMEARGFLGYRLMVFEKEWDGRFRAPAALARNALVAFGTHDLPSLRGWWDGIDIEARDRLALYPAPDMAAAERRQRGAEKTRLIEALAGEGLLDPAFAADGTLDEARAVELARALYAYLDRAPSALLMVQFEDVLGLSLQMNLPGTVAQPSNWRQRYPVPLAEMLADQRVLAVARALAGRAYPSRA